VPHSHVFDRFMVSPRLALTSPVNGCGKTTALAVIEQLAYRPQRMDNATARQHRLRPCGHDVMLDMPERLTAILQDGLSR
jgi:hypothetical protein